MTKQPTQALKSSVNSYLMARVHAELQREKVDKIQRHLLESTSYFADAELTGRRGLPTERITDPKLTYLMKDDESVDYLLDLKAELIKAGYEIKSVEGEPEHHYFCPALVAENLQNETEHLVIDSMAEMLGEGDDFRHKLLCAGLDKYKEFLDLAVKFVVNSPGFKPINL